jgi:hypothetical protein
MFFLLRIAFWLAVVCVLLPSGGAKTSSPEAQIDAAQAVTLATAAVSDMSGFCDRQRNACEVGGKVAAAIGQKAEAGARTLYEIVTTKIHEKAEQSPVSSTASSKDAAPAQRRHGTLTPDDMAPAWHAPVPLPLRRERPPV